jgi:leucine-rich repeat protein SHOC2
MSLTYEQVELKIAEAIKLNATKLDLSGNKLTHIPDNIQNLTSLTHLDLSQNYLTDFPENILQLTQLVSLGFYNNAIQEIPLGVCALTQLKFLDLKSNSLINIPECIGCLNQLDYLSFEGNHLEYLPDSICNLTELTHLNLYGMRLIKLPRNFGNLIKLTDLEIEFNRLVKLPDNFGNLIELRRLDFEGSMLNSLPESMKNMIKLESINLEDNPIIDLSPLRDLSIEVNIFSVDIPERYLIKFSDWEPKWLLDEDNAEIRKVLIEQVGYDRICQELGAVELDTWREYTLLKIEHDVDIEPIVLLKMICPSTKHIHILRVPPEIDSAESAITWINWGIHPNEIAVAT